MQASLRIGIIGDYNPQNPYHTATDEALWHAACGLQRDLETTWLPTPSLDQQLPGKAGDALLEPFHGLWCSPGSPYANMDGALKAIRWAREHDRPFVGT
jgi:CTP synthase (UTP-ammonia lyase)